MKVRRGAHIIEYDIIIIKNHNLFVDDTISGVGRPKKASEAQVLGVSSFCKFGSTFVSYFYIIFHRIL